MPIFSLPSPSGIGDFGNFSYKFVDILSENSIKFWQILPLNPTELETGNSPYMSESAFAGNFLFISPEILLKEGYLKKDDVREFPDFNDRRVEYEKVYIFKNKIIEIAYENFKRMKNKEDFEKFCISNSYWLIDYSLFSFLKKIYKKPFNEWDEKIRERDEEVLKKLMEKYKEEIEREKFKQFLFFKQYYSLKNYANKKGIKIIGDIPIYVSYNSCDVWVNPEIFKLDKDKKPLYVAGVPPDYFSKKGQLWGNPLYDWEKLAKRGFDFWIKRIEHNLKLFDYLRIDHFRGFVGYYQIPYGRTDATIGEWVPAPASEFFEFIFKNLGRINIIAEDLGFITEDVIEIMKKFKIPGMRVFQFGFGDKNPQNPHLPHNYDENVISYTSTHDTDTLKGWLYKIDKSERDFVFNYLKVKNIDDAIEKAIEALLFSKSIITIFPLQDILKMGSGGRINTPGTKKWNWRWRVDKKTLLDFANALKNYKKLIELSNR